MSSYYVARNKYLSNNATAIVGTCSSGKFLRPGAPCTNVNNDTPTISVNPAACSPQQSAATSNLRINLPNNNARIMPHFHHNLVGLCTMCDGGCTVIFNQTVVRVLSEK